MISPRVPVRCLLPALAVSSLFLLALPAAQAQTVAEQYLLAAANADRAAHQLPPVRVDEHLTLAARLHAYEMVRHRSISHRFDGETDLAARAAEAGAHFSLITENVAEAPDSSQIHELWMHSEGHRRNLLDPAVDSVGIAVIEQHGQYYAVEDFSRHVVEVPLAGQEQAVASLLERPGLQVITGSPDARQTCTMTTGHAGERLPWFVMRYTSSDLTRVPKELQERLDSGKYHEAQVGACVLGTQTAFTSYNLAVLLYPGT